MDNRMNPHAPFEVRPSLPTYPPFPPRVDERAPAWKRIATGWMAQRPAQDGAGILRKAGELGSFPNGNSPSETNP